MDTETAARPDTAARAPHRGAGKLPSAQSLRGAAQAAAAKGEPLVVMTTLKGCPFCDVVRDNYLGPMRQAGQVHAVQVDILDRQSVVQGFDGQSTSPSDLARRWNAKFAPTVLFFGPEGKELAERLQGVAVQDFYGEYLEQRLATARKALKPA
ncbi:thioredoxin fold domain-containing protein [Hydrogenophaga sp. 5NK40-0174]|uniref:thioredoxin fold domain-containing protein n=1 Tax=Hydrogenophaga sp. 5NK40-0174 TaxID=3127649 RepID=UPI00334223E6